MQKTAAGCFLGWHTRSTHTRNTNIVVRAACAHVVGGHQQTHSRTRHTQPGPPSPAQQRTHRSKVHAKSTARVSLSHCFIINIGSYHIHNVHHHLHTTLSLFSPHIKSTTQASIHSFVHTSTSPLFTPPKFAQGKKTRTHLLSQVCALYRGFACVCDV